MPSEYVLLNLVRPDDKTYEVEVIINRLAQEGWEVVGYSAPGWRGAVHPSYTHLVLLRRDARPVEEGRWRCRACRLYSEPLPLPKLRSFVKCGFCGEQQRVGDG